jgi:tRNA dimethylallyltransferase
VDFPEVIAVFGPTAAGKSAVAECLAERLGSEVVSADSMQIYEGLPVLTNQPARPTRLVGVWPLSHEGSVAEYAELAHAAIDDIVDACGTAVVAGGSGLYLRAALAELELPPLAEPGARGRWEAAYDHDAERVYAELRARDPAAATLVHPNDRRRVVRALELAEAGSSLAPEEPRLWTSETRHPSLVVGLALPDDVLVQRIEARALAMFARGVVEEVRAALRSGAVSKTADKALGLREIAELPPEDALASVVRRTRRLGAYQRKWMRRIPGIVMIDADRAPEEVANAILEVARAR